MDSKRTILAVALSMAVLVLWQYLFAPPPRPVPGEAEPQAAAQPKAPEAPANAAAPERPVPQTPGIGAPEEPQPPARAETLTLENRDVAVEIGSRGAAIRRVALKAYREAGEGEDRPVELLSAPSGLDLVGRVRLVGQAVPGDAVYRVLERAGRRAVLVWDGPGGIRVTQTFELPETGYAVGVTVEVENRGQGPLADRLAWTLVRDFSGASEDRLSRYNFHGPAYLADDEYEEVKVKKLKDPVAVSGKIRWLAMVDGYFLVAAVPASPAEEVRLGRFQGLEKVAQSELVVPLDQVSPGRTARAELKVFAGPKLREALAPLGADLTEVVHYGFFHPVAVPLLWFLKAIYRVTGNYGIAIIVLTVLVKLIFWPLSAKSYRSMQKMKEIQPKIQRLKEKCGDDKERLNREMMQLYKTHKVNPMGGCLPMLVQIPVFFALYRVLLGSIELRHAPFLLWIQDLSAKDPYYVTPLLMGLTMFLQQKLTPASGVNEGQMKMMMYGMPVVFTFLFLNFPSGLVLYWLVNNILSVAQQAWMMRESRRAAAA